MERGRRADRQKHVPILELEGGGERKMSRQTDRQTGRNMFRYLELKDRWRERDEQRQTDRQKHVTILELEGGGGGGRKGDKQTDRNMFWYYLPIL